MSGATENSMLTLKAASLAILVIGVAWAFTIPKRVVAPAKTTTSVVAFPGPAPVTVAPEPNAPDALVKSSCVLIFDSSMSADAIAAKYDSATASLNNRHTGHFSDRRVAVLFKPGTYDLDVLVGYYTQASALVDIVHNDLNCHSRTTHTIGAPS
jgi:hypothetical protein